MASTKTFILIFIYRESILPSFYEQLLRMQIPKVQKDSQVKLLFALSGSAGIKAARKNIDEIDPRTNCEVASGKGKLLCVAGTTHNTSGSQIS